MLSNNLRSRDADEVLCKMIIVDGIVSIQAGENPKSLREKLLTFMAQQQRDAAMGGGRGSRRRSGSEEE